MALLDSDPSLHWRDANVDVHKVVVGPFDNNVFVVRCRRSGDAVLIDAANEHEQLLQLCKRLGVKRVLETHGHWDHIQAVPAMREAGYEVAVTALDAPRLKDVGYDVFIDDAEIIEDYIKDAENGYDVLLKKHGLPAKSIQDADFDDYFKGCAFVLKKYKDFPIKNSIPTILNTAAQSLPIIFLTKNYSIEIVGYYLL
ncbi:MAG: MBL fold metallo-hydrolase, partial [Ilumatobacteraceae bacterium]